MSKKCDLIELLSTHHRAVRKLLDTVTEEGSMHRPEEKANHVRWIAGHMVGGAEAILKLMGADDHDSPAWLALFARGSMADSDPSAYPAMAEIRAHLYALYEEQQRVLDAMSEGDFERRLDSETEEGSSSLKSIQFLCSHEFYHLGQIMYAQRLQGRDRMFG